MDKKILITGGNSKIGRQLIERLRHDNLSVRILTRKSSNLNNIEIVFGDLLKSNSLSKAVQGIDEIIHLAAITHSNIKKRYWRVNVVGTENLIKAAQRAKVSRFVFVSTRAINSNGGDYSRSKLVAEEIVKNSNINWIILRPSEIYGMKQGEMIDQLIKFIKKFYLVPVIKTNQNILAPLYINDLVDVLEKIIFRNNILNKIYNLAGPESFSFSELIDQICQFYQLKRLKIYCPLFLLKLVFGISRLVSIRSFLVYDQIARLLSSKSDDISLARKDLEFYPINFQKGLFLKK